MHEPSVLPAIHEVRRLASPAPLPQALAVPHGGACLYLAPREVPLFYAIDVSTLTVTAEFPIPGPAWGAIWQDRRLVYVASDGPADDRVVRSYDLDTDASDEILSCPEATGSYLATRDGSLFLTQFYRRRMLRLATDGAVVSQVAIPHDVCGIADGGDAFYLVTTDDEESEAYFLTRVGFGDTPAIEDVARIPFRARSLAWDGTRFWTCHRERHEVVAFDRP